MKILKKLDINNKLLLSNFLSLSILQVFSYLLPLITQPYLVNVLTTEYYGLIMFSQSFIMFLFIIVDFGFNLSAVKLVTNYRDNKLKLQKIYSSILIIKTILLSIALLLLIIITSIFDKFQQYKPIYFLSFLYIIGQAYFPIWLFQGLEKMKFITFVNILVRILFTCSIFILVKEINDFYLVPILNGIGSIIGALISLYIVKYKFNIYIKQQSINRIYYYAKDSFQYFLSRISINIYTSSNAFILGLFTNNTIVGYYSMAEQLYRAMLSLTSPLINSIYPYMLKTKNIIIFRNILVFSSTFILLVCILLLYFDKILLEFIYRNSVNEIVITSFNIFLFIFIIVFISSMLGYPLLGAFGFYKYANNSIIYGSLLYFLLLISFILLHKNISIYTLLKITLSTEIMILLYRVIFINKHLRSSK